MKNGKIALEMFGSIGSAPGIPAFHQRLFATAQGLAGVLVVARIGASIARIFWVEFDALIAHLRGHHQGSWCNQKIDQGSTGRVLLTDH